MQLKGRVTRFSEFAGSGLAILPLPESIATCVAVNTQAITRLPGSSLQRQSGNQAAPGHGVPKRRAEMTASDRFDLDRFVEMQAPRDTYPLSASACFAGPGVTAAGHPRSFLG
jgi:hypothetical protein